MTDQPARINGSDTPEDDGTEWTRRRFLLGAASLALVAIAADPAVAAAEPACAPADPGQVVAVVDWAWVHGWTVRARGSAHGWSPLTITSGTESDAPVLIRDGVWRQTVGTLDRIDPHRVFGNAFLDRLLR